MGEVAPADPTAALHVRVSQLRRALADFADEEFARVAVARWEEQRLAAVEAYAEARLDLGAHCDLVGELGDAGMALIERYGLHVEMEATAPIIAEHGLIDGA